MNIDLVFKIAATGIIVAVLNQLLTRSGREDQAMMTTLAGLIVVLSMLVRQISDLFVLIKALSDCDWSWITMLILKAAALAIVVCVLVLCLKKDQPGFAFLLSLCGAAGLLWFAVQQLRPLLARLQQLAGQAGGDSFSILLQVLAIAFVAQLAADLCREAGLAAAAFCMEFVGRILAMLQALPLLQSLLASFLSFLS